VLTCPPWLTNCKLHVRTRHDHGGQHHRCVCTLRSAVADYLLGRHRCLRWKIDRDTSFIRNGDGVCDRIENHLRRICNSHVSGSSILLSKTVAQYLSDSLPVRSCCPFRLRSFGGTLDGAHVDGVWKPAFPPVWNA